MNREINISFIKKISENRNKIAIAGIMVVAILHSVGQLSFIQNESLRSEELAAQTENGGSQEIRAEIKQPAQVMDIKPEADELRTIKVADVSENTRSHRRIEALPPQTKKKAVRETKEARLRRAERILTGV